MENNSLVNLLPRNKNIEYDKDGNIKFYLKQLSSNIQLEMFAKEDPFPKHILKKPKKEEN